jgi:protein O-GlcNAc transferase
LNRKERRAAAKLGQPVVGQGAQLISAKPQSVADRAFQDGLRAHSAGSLPEAERYYREALASDSQHVGALHYLGALAQQVGQHPFAIDLIGLAVKLKPDYVEAHCNLANSLKAVGRRSEAAASYRRAIELQPNFAAAHCNLGILLLEMGDLDGSLASMKRAAAIDPNLFDAQANIAALLQKRGDLPGAMAQFRKVLAINPRHAESHFNLGCALADLGDIPGALDSYRKAEDLKPEFLEAHNNLLQLLQRSGRNAQAIQELRARANAHPGVAELKSVLADALQSEGEVEAAIALYAEALKLKPGLVKAQIGLGVVLKNQGRMDDAIACFREALRIDPAAAAAYVNLGGALRDQGDYREAREAYDRALMFQPDADGFAVLRAAVLPIIAPSIEELVAERERFASDHLALEKQGYRVADPLASIGQTNFYLAYAGLDDREIQEQVARFYLKACPSLGWNAVGERKSRTAGRRYRIGIASAYLHAHTIGRLTQGVIERLDRERFEVIVCRPPGKTDAMSEAIDRAADRVIAIPRNLDAARRAIADAELDLLYYTDIGMDALTYFLAYARLAPVQVTGWGHPVTTGIPTVDYFLSADSMEPDGAEDHYSERLVRLARPPTFYKRPAFQPLADARGRLGLPQDARLYICAQSLFKFHPSFDETLDAILRNDPDGRLVLVSAQQATYAELILARFRNRYPETADRIIVLSPLPHGDFLNLLSTADVLLDTHYFGGGNTNYEAMSMGLPIVTWPGNFMRGRVTAALYHTMGVTDLIAGSSNEYVALANRVACDPSYRCRIVDDIRTRSAILYENTEIVPELEAFFVAAIESERNGTPLSTWK